MALQTAHPSARRALCDPLRQRRRNKSATQRLRTSPACLPISIAPVHRCQEVIRLHSGAAEPCTHFYKSRPESQERIAESLMNRLVTEDFPNAVIKAPAVRSVSLVSSTCAQTPGENKNTASKLSFFQKTPRVEFLGHKCYDFPSASFPRLQVRRQT